MNSVHVLVIPHETMKMTLFLYNHINVIVFQCSSIFKLVYNEDISEVEYSYIQLFRVSVVHYANSFDELYVNYMYNKTFSF